MFVLTYYFYRILLYVLVIFCTTKTHFWLGNVIRGWISWLLNYNSKSPDSSSVLAATDLTPVTQQQLIQSSHTTRLGKLLLNIQDKWIDSCVFLNNMWYRIIPVVITKVSVHCCSCNSKQSRCITQRLGASVYSLGCSHSQYWAKVLCVYARVNMKLTIEQVFFFFSFKTHLTHKKMNKTVFCQSDMCGTELNSSVTRTYCTRISVAD